MLIIRFGGVVISVIMLLISLVKFNGIIRCDGDVCICMVMFNIMGIKIVIMLVEFINVLSFVMVSINKINILILLLFVILISYVFITVVISVRIKLSLIINKAVIRITLGLEKSENIFGIVSVSFNVNAIIINKAIVFIRILFVVNKTMVTVSNERI